VTRVRDDLAARLDAGVTLPFSWFADPEIFRAEQERIFAHTWQYAVPTSWVSEAGEYATCHAGLVPIVVVRDHDGRLNGFVNICRHRATEVAQGRGTRETLQCPYHAWTYGLDGGLRAAPRSDREPGFDAADLCLLRVAVDTWGPFVFVNRDLDAAPLAEVLGELPARVAAAGIDLGALHHRNRAEWEIAANWKAIVENYLECYHCPTAHPGFSKLIDVDPDAYTLESGAWHSSQIGQVRAAVANGNGSAPYRLDGDVHEAHFHYVWPTFTINVLPGPPNLGAFFFVPLDADRTLTIIDYFYGDAATEDDIRGMEEFGEQVGQEDQALVESIQRAARSGGLSEGRLLLESEHLIQHFQRLVERALR
jgi:phenylpropionate dioxygenase-like ring-hydroxylating dioxygenase large terminal subunit